LGIPRVDIQPGLTTFTTAYGIYLSAAPSGVTNKYGLVVDANAGNSGFAAGVNQELLGECRALVLAMVAAWRFDKTDQLPNGHRAGRQLIDALRHGPPYPTLDSMMGDS